MCANWPKEFICASTGGDFIQWLHLFRRKSAFSHFYRPQTKFAKVMFLQVSVCPHGGGMRGFIRGACVVLFGGHAWFYLGGCMVLFGRGMLGFIWGTCVVLFGGTWFYLGGCVWFYSGGIHGFIWGACVVLFGGHAWFFWGGMCGFSGGACMVFSVFSDTMRYGQWVGGTHPTGMHSCYTWLHTWLMPWLNVIFVKFSNCTLFFLFIPGQLFVERTVSQVTLKIYGQVESPKISHLAKKS